ncbi:MAG: serine/threonine protein phosphatase, partial [Parvularculaceae bacterium]|nr:serine/threonine protein phosphatase [Parvularculaceae bacterium]
AVGDVHGRLDLLDALMKRLDEEGAREQGARLIFLGDYVDRGPSIREVVERLTALKTERPQSIFLLGNHEQVLAEFLAAPERRADWLDWGGEETAASYGVAHPERRTPRELAEELAQLMPPTHRAFLTDLAPSASLGDYFFAHAGVRPGVPLDQQSVDDLLWIREAFHDARPDQRPDKVVVHGHHPVRKPLDLGWRIAIDTGAVYGGKLTAVVLDGSTRRFVSVE